MRKLTLKLLLFLCPLALNCSAQSEFTSVDVGRTTPVGQTIAVTNGFDVSSATGDIWDYADDFRFVYQLVSGDFDFHVRVQSLTGVGYWTKVGVMLRENLNDNAVNGFMVATRTGGWGRYMFTARLADTYPSYVYFQGSFERVQYPNVWLRLARVGNNIMPMHSTNGFNWTQIGNQDFGLFPRRVFVGMAVSNHPDSGSIKATGQFRDIALDTGVPVAPAIITQPISQTVNPGSDVSFSVTVVGQNPISYQWFRNGGLIKGATNVAYSLHAVQKADVAKFTCRISNDAGEVMSWAGFLEVEEAGRPFDGIASERFSRVYGRLIAYMVDATNYPNAPSGTNRPNLFEIPGTGDDTGGRIRGYLTPPVTGNYTFYIAADDRGELWVSTDDNPANKRQIAECFYWVNPRQWEYYDTQTSIPIRLKAGQRYYIEALYKGEGSPNQCAIGWRLPDGKFERPIPATRFFGGGSLLRINQTAQTLSASVEGTLDSLYVLQGTTNLLDWVPILTNRSPFQIGISSWPASLGFFRAVVSP